MTDTAHLRIRHHKQSAKVRKKISGRQKGHVEQEIYKQVSEKHFGLIDYTIISALLAILAYISL